MRRVSLLTVLLVVALGGARAAAAPSLAISGNHFVDATGKTVRLLGVDHPSFEYACEEGYAYDDGNMDAPDAAAIASWHATAVRVPLNEDCWLGLNGQPNSSQGADPPLTVAGYRAAVGSYVKDLEDAGLYVILDLHWSAPGSVVADGQRPMPDDHSAAFWTSVAQTFKDDHAVVFDVFNEPFSPADVNDPGFPVSWSCWRDGGCKLPSSADGKSPDNGHPYTAVGMQALVDAIRATGATQPIMLGGLSYANDLSQWLASEPKDPLNQLAASFHEYEGNTCGSAACWNTTTASVAAKVPVVTGEFGEEVCNPSSFDADYLNWADAHGVSYLAWGWWVLSQSEISAAGCSAYYLISDPRGTPASVNGTTLHDHLAALFAAGTVNAGTSPAGGGTTAPPPSPTGPTPPTTGTPAASKLSSLHATLARDRRSVSFVVRATHSCTATVSARTATKVKVPGRRSRQVLALGSPLSLSLTANTARKAVLRVSSAARRLLAAHASLRVRVAVTLTTAAGARSATSTTLTLRR